MPVSVALGAVAGGETGPNTPPAPWRHKSFLASPPTSAEPSGATAAERRSRVVPHGPELAHPEPATPAAASSTAPPGPTSAIRPPLPTTTPCPPGPTATAYAGEG